MECLEYQISFYQMSGTGMCLCLNVCFCLCWLGLCQFAKCGFSGFVSLHPARSMVLWEIDHPCKKWFCFDVEMFRFDVHRSGFSMVWFCSWYNRQVKVWSVPALWFLRSIDVVDTSKSSMVLFWCWCNCLLPPRNKIWESFVSSVASNLWKWKDPEMKGSSWRSLSPPLSSSQGLKITVWHKYIKRKEQIDECNLDTIFCSFWFLRDNNNVTSDFSLKFADISQIIEYIFRNISSKKLNDAFIHFQQAIPKK